MTQSSEFDELAVRMENAVERFIGDQHASKNFVQLRFSTDPSEVGAYPQALQNASREYFEDDGDPYRDRLPVLIQDEVDLKLAKSAKWTDVMSSDLWSEGFLANDKVMSIIRNFQLGRNCEYPTRIHKSKEFREYTFIFFANHVGLDDIEFKKSQFYIADMLGSPIKLVSVDSASDFEEKRRQISQGELDGIRRFSRLETKRIHFKNDRIPKSAIFGLGTFGPDLYVSKELYQSIHANTLTGLEFRRNNRLFDS